MRPSRYAGAKDMAAGLMLGGLMMTAPVGGQAAPVPVEQKAVKDERSLPLFLHLLRLKEGSKDSGQVADGDNGQAIGNYQIHHDYWVDAVHANPSLKNFKDKRGNTRPAVYTDCRDFWYATNVVSSYLHHYCPAAVASNDFETMARTHNGGPHRKGTDGYWQAFVQVMVSDGYRDMAFELMQRHK